MDTVRALSANPASRLHYLVRDIVEYQLAPLLTIFNESTMDATQGTTDIGHHFMFPELVKDKEHWYHAVFNPKRIAWGPTLTDLTLRHPLDPHMPSTARLLRSLLSNNLRYDAATRTATTTGKVNITPTRVTPYGIICELQTNRWCILHMIDLSVTVLDLPSHVCNLASVYDGTHITYHTQQDGVFTYPVTTLQLCDGIRTNTLVVPTPGSYVMHINAFQNKYVLVAYMYAAPLRFCHVMEWLVLDFNGDIHSTPVTSVINQQDVSRNDAANCYIDQHGVAHMYVAGKYVTWNYYATK